MGKDWWKSKTIWANAIALISTLFGLLGYAEIPPDQQAAVVAGVMTIVNIALRFVTSEPIKKPGGAPPALPALILGLIFASSVALGGCASRVAETPAQKIYALQADYAAMLEAALAYESLPRCVEDNSVPSPCSDSAIVEGIRKADIVAYEAIGTARETIRASPADIQGIDLALLSARQAIDGLARIIATLNGRTG